jgi:regulator of nucleoside diphosphate kinase
MLADSYPVGPKPPILISERDLWRLEQLASRFDGRENAAAEFLADELERAEICPADRIPADVVTMNALVAFRLEPAGSRQRRILVYPEAYAAAARPEGCVSVLTPVGAALIGLRVGSRLAYPALGGRELALVVEAVEQRAAAAGGTAPATVAGEIVAFPMDRPARRGPRASDDPGPDAA